MYHPTPSDDVPDDAGPGGQWTRPYAVIDTVDDVWAGLGFEHFRDGVHVLELNLVTLNEKPARLTERAAGQRSHT